MNTNVNLAAPVGALALLGTGALVLMIAAVLIYFRIIRKYRRARIVATALGAVIVLYGSALLVFSVTSHYKLLTRGEEKHFCELDCHLAYSIVNIAQLPASATQVPTVVTIKTRFDQQTIAPWRGNAPLYPNSRAVTLFDDLGETYAPTSSSGSALTSPLRPGESYTTDVTFNLSPGRKPVRLLINEADWVTHFIIGHENSPLHRKTEFAL